MAEAIGLLLFVWGDIMQLPAVSWLIASVSFRLSKHWSHTDFQQRGTLFHLKPGKFGTDRPDGQNYEYPPFANHPQAVLNCFWLSGQPASLGHAQRQPSPFSDADNKKYTYTTQKTSVTHCSSLKAVLPICQIVCRLWQNVIVSH